MTTSLAEKLGVSTAPNIYSIEAFRNLYLNHLDVIIDTREYEMFLPTPREQYTYASNLTGFLNKKKIPLELHWFVMTLSGMTKPENFTVETQSILVPNAAYIDRLRAYYLTKNE